MKQQFLEAGRIVRTHGVRGELVLEPWADSPEFLTGIRQFSLDPAGQRTVEVLASRIHKGRLLLRLRGVDTVEQGDALRGKVLYLDRDGVRLEEGRFFLQDLLGCSVVDGVTGQVYGVLEEVLSTPANDVYRIKNGEREFLFPAVEHMIKGTDLEAGVIEVLPIPGIFDNEGEEA